jgi:TorA maturation chaperone TorD
VSASVATGAGAGAAARAEFYLCLARAFLPPREAGVFEALSGLLGDDLAELGGALGYPIEGEIASYREAIRDVRDRDALLQLYSALFLVPPAPAPLNAAIYLDASVNGVAAAAIERAYRDCGVERHERFGDLPDHVACQLEFVALLLARKAAGQPPARGVSADWFLDGFVRGWAPALRAALEEAEARGAFPRPYSALARILEHAVEHDLRTYRRPVDPAEARRAELVRSAALGSAPAAAS